MNLGLFHTNNIAEKTNTRVLTQFKSRTPLSERATAVTFSFASAIAIGVALIAFNCKTEDKHENYKNYPESVIPKTIEVRYSNTHVLVKEPGAERRALIAAKSIESINSALPAKLIQKVVMEKYSAILDPKKIFCTQAYYCREDSIIYIGACSLSDSLSSVIIPSHEEAHAYFNRDLADVDKQHLDSLYNKVRKIILRHEFEQEHPLIQLFCESAYGVKDCGHPWSNTDEFFASATTVLKYFHKEFFENLNAMEQKNSKRAHFARYCAREVVDAFGNARIFDDQVYVRLGLSKP